MKPLTIILYATVTLCTTLNASPPKGGTVSANKKPTLSKVQIHTNTTRLSQGKAIWITAYCKCPLCCGRWSKYGRTASGTIPTPNHTAACNFLSFGTRIRVGERIYTVEDRLAKRFSDRIDIYFNSHKEALKFGKQQLKVTIIK